jgi:hypothetical protein
MIAPVQSKDRLYRDDRIIVQFRLEESAVRFQLQNLSDSTLLIDWPHASIGVRGIYSPVRNLSVFYDTVSVRPAGCFIPPLGVIRDVILPEGNTHFDGSRWRREDLLPTTDGNSPAMKNTIAGMVGSPIDVLLPVAVGGAQHQYHFTLAVDSISQLRWDEYRAASWLPSEPPVRHGGPTIGDNITAVIVVSGILGFFSYMLVAKKSPVSR